MGTKRPAGVPVSLRHHGTTSEEVRMLKNLGVVSPSLFHGFATDVTVDAARNGGKINPEVYGLLSETMRSARMGVPFGALRKRGITRFTEKTSSTNTGGDGSFSEGSRECRG